MSPPVLYAEVPGFYAEVERARDPELARRPVVVGGDPRKRGLVQSATDDALAEGVELGMPVHDALLRCPRARALHTNMRRYREAAIRLRSCLRRAAQRLEPAGLGAAYLDPERGEEPLVVVAAELRKRVAEEVGLPLRVGIAPARVLARLAAEEAGPEGVREVRAGDVTAFLAPLPVSRLPGVGPRTATRLAELGATTVGGLVALGRATLEEEFGNHGLAILEVAHGRGPARVRAASHPRSLSLESTLARPERDLGVLRERVADLATRLAEALRLDSLAAGRVGVKVRFADQETTTRSRTLPQPARTAAQIEEAAQDLLGRTGAGARPVRLVGLSLASLVRSRHDDRQLRLFPED
jgi:nucleotidyltransferase/DNA polymerase involved in DNA repair